MARVPHPDMLGIPGNGSHPNPTFQGLFTGRGRRILCRKDLLLSQTTSTAALRPAISETERARRLKAVNFARGSVRYEGGILSDEIERLNARYAAGEIGSDELTAAILGVRHRPLIAIGTITCGGFDAPA